MSAGVNDCFVVIPAFNEGPVIRNVVAGVRSLGYRVVVVDDGSADQTADEAAAGGAMVIRHPVNLGQGAALQTGISFALEHGAAFVLTYDADGQHDPADLERLLAPLRAGQADIVLGSRFLGETVGATRARRTLLRLATLFTRLTTGLKLTDAHNGLRGFSRRAASRLRISQNRMAHASELLAFVAKSGFAWIEVPVTIRYSAYSMAKGQRMKDSLTILLDLFAGSLQR